MRNRKQPGPSMRIAPVAALVAVAASVSVFACVVNAPAKGGAGSSLAAASIVPSASVGHAASSSASASPASPASVLPSASAPLAHPVAAAQPSDDDDDAPDAPDCVPDDGIIHIVGRPPRQADAGAATATLAKPTVYCHESKAVGREFERLFRALRRETGRFQACFEDALRKDPHLHGAVQAGFVIMEDGSPLWPLFTGQTLMDRGVTDCCEKIVSSLTFSFVRSRYAAWVPFQFDLGK